MAARHGVTVAPGSGACLDGRHRQFVRLSFAEQLDTLELAVERLAAAWQAHTQNLAATPSRTADGMLGALIIGRGPDRGTSALLSRGERDAR